MKKMILAAVFGLMAVTSMVVMAGCKPTAKKICVIHGTMESSRWDGKKIFLVPMFGLQDAAHVDSVVIKDGKFEFTADTTEMKVIRVDYHFRDGVQDLLVVSEPGDVKVTIGSNSISGGTPQNDSLQVWKDKVISFNTEYNKLRMQVRQGGSTDSLMAKGKEIQNAMREFNVAFAQRQPEGVFKNFLKNMYPSK